MHFLSQKPPPRASRAPNTPKSVCIAAFHALTLCLLAAAIGTGRAVLYTLDSLDVLGCLLLGLGQLPKLRNDG